MDSKIDFRIYLITNRLLLAPGTIADRVGILVKAGIGAVQIREKDLPARNLIELAYQIRRRAENFPLKLFINDRADIAFSVQADGLHIPEHGLPIPEARKITGETIIGKSVHSLESAIQAQSAGADFITFGPIYDTPSKRQYGEPFGIEKLREVIKQISIPVFAIGGINPERAKECIDAGAYGVSVVSDLLCAANPELQVKKYFDVLGSL